MPSTKDIRRRIKSVSSTKKITKAMELVSAAKMRRAIEAVLRTRTYANLSWQTVLNLSRMQNGSEEPMHPLLAKRDNVRKTAIVLIASNRGLCGGYNTAIVEKLHQSVLRHLDRGGADPDIILLGKRGAAAYRYHGYKIAAEFPKADIASGVAEVLDVARLIIDDYSAGKYDKILVAYTDYVSAAKQEARVKQILPIDLAAADDHLGIVGKDTRLKTEKGFIEDKAKLGLRDEQYKYEYKFEPSPREVLSDMIPRLIEVQLYQALLEANASEHSARMAAMRQATDAANDMVAELTLSYNKARQGAITNEIAEISAGANALAEG